MHVGTLGERNARYIALRVEKETFYHQAVFSACFESFGFEPLQTPAVERIETLMGKYGDEGNKLIFQNIGKGKSW